MGGFGWQELLLILVIVLVIFGTTRIKSIGGDLGSAIKSFRKGMAEADKVEEDFANIDLDVATSSSEEDPGEESDTKNQDNS